MYIPSNGLEFDYSPFCQEFNFKYRLVSHNYLHNNYFSLQGNEMIADRGLNSSVTIISDSNYSQINNSPSNVYASNHQEEASTQLREKVSSNSTAQCLIDANERQFDEPRMSEEIVPVPLDDIQIHEDDDQQSGEDETAEVPFSDAPIIGAPFRLISFVARYVSGADLVSEK